MNTKRELTSFDEFCISIARAHWQINYPEFCRRAGFQEDDYSDGKWRDWQQLVTALKAFDTSTLERIVYGN